jgi:flagellar M-ring protein FliF
LSVQNILNVWSSLNPRRRLVVLLATAAMFACVLALARMAASPGMSLLYSGLESGPAGEVVAALEQRGVAYDVRGGAIFVESAERDTLRMTLASEGLPTASSRGYELLDGLSGFGTTSQMFNAAYWRAKEGELARTIVSHPKITAARVHIANAGNNPFQRNMSASASVSITTAGGEISAKYAKALKFLVASAVTGLEPEDVSVIDSSGELVGTVDETPVNATDDRAETLRQRVSRLLEARVGPGNAVVEVSVETVTRSESLRERVIDPESRVAISIDSEETSNLASDKGGDVTVASNLPDGDAGNEESSSQTSATRERVNYEISETEREITMAPGAIKRLSVAVLVNGVTTLDATAAAESFTPRSEEELDALRDLVAAAVGFDEARGDIITIKTMQFEAVDPAGTLVEDSFLSSFPLDVMSLAQMAVLGLVALLIGLFVVRPVLANPATGELQRLPTPTQSGERDAAQAQSTALTGEIDTGEVDEGSMSVVPSAPDLPDGPDISLNDALGGKMPEFGMVSADPVERLRNLIDDRRTETVEILRSWLDGEEENA